MLFPWQRSVGTWNVPMTQGTPRKMFSACCSQIYRLGSHLWLWRDDMADGSWPPPEGTLSPVHQASGHTAVWATRYSLQLPPRSGLTWRTNRRRDDWAASKSMTYKVAAFTAPARPLVTMSIPVNDSADVNETDTKDNVLMFLEKVATVWKCSVQVIHHGVKPCQATPNIYIPFILLPARPKPLICYLRRVAASTLGFSRQLMTWDDRWRNENTVIWQLIKEVILGRLAAGVIRPAGRSTRCPDHLGRVTSSWRTAARPQGDGSVSFIYIGAQCGEPGEDYRNPGFRTWGWPSYHHTWAISVTSMSSIHRVPQPTIAVSYYTRGRVSALYRHDRIVTGCFRFKTIPPIFYLFLFFFLLLLNSLLFLLIFSSFHL